MNARTTEALWLAAALLAGCTPADSGPGSARNSPLQVATWHLTPADLHKIATTQRDPGLYIQVSALGNLDYFSDHRLGLELAGAALGVRTQYEGPSEYDMTAMINALELAIARKPGGLIVVGFEPSLTPIVDKAVAQGIPVVTVDADLPDSKRIAFVGTGNFQAGVQGGTKLAALVGERGEVALLTKVGQSNLEERVAGYRLALERFPLIRVVQVVNTESDAIKAAQAASMLLQKYPQLAGLGCVEAAGGAGAATAVREARKAGLVKIVAMDRGNEVLQAIGEGVITATIVQQTALMPFYAVQILHNLNQRPIAIAADNPAAGVPATPIVVDTGVIVVDAGNYRQFVRD